MDKLRNKYKKDIERQNTIKVTETGNIRITRSTEKLTGDDLLKFLNEQTDGLEGPMDCEDQDEF